MRATIVGAGSTYTPELVAGLLAQTERLALETLVLVDIDERRLEVLAGFVRRMAPGLEVHATSSIVDGVGGARLVFSQFRVGGQAARESDERLGRRWGIVGQETTGVGGLAKGLRTIPAALEVQAAVAAHAAANAWLVNFTNPAGMVTEALLTHGVGDPPRVVGLCNFPWVLRERLAAGLAVSPDQVDLDYVGLNHLAWVRDVRVDGDSDFAAARTVWRSGPDAPFADRLLDDVGPILNPYLQYYYETQRLLAAQQASPTRASVVADLESELLEKYADPATQWHPDLLADRGGTSYSVAAARLAADLVAPTGAIPRRHVLNVRNDGALPGLPDDAVVETSCVVDARGATPVPTAELGRPERGLANQVKDFERYAIEAATTGDHGAARMALTTHPLCPDAASAGALLDDLLSTNRAWLADVW